MRVPSDLLDIANGLAASISRSYFASLQILGDPALAEALVIEAIDSLHPESVTGNAIRNAVVTRLVSAQLNGIQASAQTVANLNL